MPRHQHQPISRWLCLCQNWQGRVIISRSLQGGTSACRYLDSDGLNGYSNTLLLGNTSNNPLPANVPRQAPIDAMDGSWHMVTVTSQVHYGSPGYRRVTQARSHVCFQVYSQLKCLPK